MNLIEQLERDLERVREVAAEAVEGVEDGGTCNLDCVFLRTGRNCRIKRRTKALDEVIDGTRSGWLGQTGYLMGIGAQHGQANRRTKAVQAALSFLREQGWDVSLYSQMD